MFTSMINKKKLEASSYGSCLIKKNIWQAENKFSVIMHGNICNYCIAVSTFSYLKYIAKKHLANEITSRWS